MTDIVERTPLEVMGLALERAEADNERLQRKLTLALAEVEHLRKHLEWIEASTDAAASAALAHQALQWP